MNTNSRDAGNSGHKIERRDKNKKTKTMMQHGRTKTTASEPRCSRLELEIKEKRSQIAYPLSKPIQWGSPVP